MPYPNFAYTVLIIIAYLPQCTNIISISAQQKANDAFRISFQDTKIGKLFWQAKSKKGKKQLYPVREVTLEETVGLALREWNGEKECPIQHIQYPHNQIKGHDVGRYDIASRNALTPYHGGDGDDINRDHWCSTKFTEYTKQLKRSHKGLHAIDIKTEELFLQTILQKSLEEGEHEKKCAEVDMALPEEVSPPSDEEEKKMHAESDDSDEDESQEEIGGVTKRRTRGSTSGAHERTERLRPNDRIAFYKQQSVAGDPRGYCEAKILYIDPKSDYPLQLDEGFTNLEQEHQVKRIQRYERGKLVNNDGGQFRAINKYILKKEGDPDALSKVLAGQTARTNEIIQRRKAEAIANMKKDGFCPEDMLR